MFPPPWNDLPVLMLSVPSVRGYVCPKQISLAKKDTTAKKQVYSSKSSVL